MNEQNSILWYCWFGTGIGYTSVSETIIPAMEELGYNVYINDGLYGGGVLLDPHFGELYGNYYKDMIICWSPEYFNVLSGDYKIGWMFMESTRLPFFHVNSCNNMNYIIVNSEWMKNTLITSGVAVPIYIVPPCIDTKKFPATGRPDPHLCQIPENPMEVWKSRPFTFLHNGFLQERKNPFQMLDGYISTFPDNGETKFIVFSKYIEEVNTMMREKYGYRADIEFVFNKTPFTLEEMVNLYHRADCYINISHGEGLSMPDMEAMSTGLPVIGSNWDTRGTFLDDEVGWMVKISGYSKAYTGMEDICGQWAEYDTEDYKRLLKYVVEHPKEVERKGKKAAERIRNDFSPKRAALELNKMLQEVQDVIP
jgi:glycosyltransferase involved in cell wall biosynthesis